MYVLPQYWRWWSITLIMDAVRTSETSVYSTRLHGVIWQTLAPLQPTLCHCSVLYSRRHVQNLNIRQSLSFYLFWCWLYENLKIRVLLLMLSKDFSSNLCVQTGSGAHPASCTMGTGGPFPGGKARRGVMLTTHPHLVPRSWMSRSYTSSPLKRLHGM
jgi:hypothetical protein